ncbi:MAG: efflux RND transporter permease subunit [Deltaproteobacteria bacterium]|nr:efflux RND transporter permease subunit [Deltaproteobacteria bacterium]
MTIRTLIAGQKVTDLPLGGDRIDVRVQVEDYYRRQPDPISRLKVRAAAGLLVDLGSVVSVARGAGPARIERYSRQRQVTVMANLEDKVLGEAVTEVDAVAAQVVPRHLDTGWTGMADVMGESFRYMFQALALAVILVYLILAAQFESLVHPLTIMLSLPLSVVGAFGALALAGLSLSLLSMIGFIMLMGLVTKNAVLLVDYTNTLRRRGMGMTEALLAAGPVRLRPILMTTAAMVFGMLPVAFGRSVGSEIRAPMAIVVIGGLLTSTLLTLVVVPVVYSLLDRFAVRRSAATAPEPSPRQLPESGN